MAAIDASSMIISSADFKITLKGGAISLPLLTVEDLSFDSKRDSETFYAIGQVEPIGSKSNAKHYSGGIKLQIGEWQKHLTAAGLAEGVDVQDATLAISSINPLNLWARTYTGLNIIDESLSVKSKASNVTIDLKWEASVVKASIAAAI